MALINSHKIIAEKLTDIEVKFLSGSIEPRSIRDIYDELKRARDNEWIVRSDTNDEWDSYYFVVTGLGMSQLSQHLRNYYG